MYVSDYLLYLHNHPLAFTAVLVVMGLLCGSFFNVVIHRLPRMLERDWHQIASEHLKENPLPIELPSPYSLVVPRSACPVCQRQIKSYENIPVLSYLFLRGKCRGCSTHISLRYPFVELLGGLAGLMSAWKFGVSLEAIFAFVFLCFLLCLTFIDLDHTILPDDMTLSLMWLGLLINTQGTFTSLENAVWGAVAGYVSLWSVYWAFKLIRGKEGMGYGDFKLNAALGAWVGWNALPFIVLASSVLGLIVAIVLMVAKKQDVSKPIPFGPYLATAGILELFFQGSRWFS